MTTHTASSDRSVSLDEIFDVLSHPTRRRLLTNTVSRGPRFEEIRALPKPMRDHRDELPEDWP